MPLEAKANIRNNCFQKWKNNYEMVEYCIKEQTEALSVLRRSPSTPIKNRCMGKWKENYEMVNYCIKEQSGAARRLGVTGEFSGGNASPSASPSRPQRAPSGNCSSWIVANGVKHCM